MNDYRIEFRPAALREIRKIDRSTQPRIQGVIALLAQDPRPPASRPLRGRPGYRLRVGDYRIIYIIDDGVLLIVVVTIGHRRDVYQLPRLEFNASHLIVEIEKSPVPGTRSGASGLRHRDDSGHFRCCIRP